MSEVASNGLIEIRVPDIGNYKDVEVIEVGVKAGDSVAVEGTLITLETEKATMDVPSTTAGVVRELKVQRGSRVSQGDVIAVVEAAASAEAVAPAPEPVKAAVAATTLRQRTAARAGGRSPDPVRCGAAGRARDGAQRHDRRAGIRACACQSFDPQAGARTRRRPHEGAGLGR